MIRSKKCTTDLWVVALLHLVVEHIEIALGRRILVGVVPRGRRVRPVRPLRVSQGEEVARLDERRHKLGVAQRLHAGVARVHRVLHRALPIRVLVHNLQASSTHEEG